MAFTDAQGYTATTNRFTMENVPWGEKPDVLRTLRIYFRLEALEFVFLLASTFFVMKHPPQKRLSSESLSQWTSQCGLAVYGPL